jgi:8-oxo-dGTP pyrophosphatase MutT (NUDIX family)
MNYSYDVNKVWKHQEYNKYNNICNNCGKYGHLFKQCKVPITSYGVVLFRIHQNKRQYLMIRRKDTLGYIDFLRGKYSTHDYSYILNMMKQMTNTEKNQLKIHDFHTLWVELWKNYKSHLYKTEYESSKIKFNTLINNLITIDNEITNELFSIIKESDKFTKWIEPEWGFPKGRRNFLESDYNCALREMNEETGYNIQNMVNIKNILPFEEIFIGSNYKTYKHKYYLMFMELDETNNTTNYDHSEVSLMEWKSFNECIEIIRPYNLEKKKLITRIENTLINTWN